MMGGLVLTVWQAVAMAFRIPANFTVDSDGLDALVELVRKYELRGYILLISLGLALVLLGVLWTISPRKRRVPFSPTVEAAREGTAFSVTAESSEPGELEPPLCVLRTQLMGTSFRGAPGESRQSLLARAVVGDILLCRGVPGHQFAETVGVYTISGALLGYLDTAFVRDLRSRYPSHRVGITVEQVSGGEGIPYRCLLRVGVYRA